MTLLYDVALFLTHDTFHILLFLFGIFAIDRNKFIQIIAICLFTSLLNVKLKEYFAIPLHHKPDWFSYPSGHTNFNVVLWGAIFITFKNWKTLLFPAIIFPFFFMGMLHYNYHTQMDIAAGIAESIIVLIIYYYSLRLSHNKYSVFLGAITFSSALLIYFVAPQYQKSWLYMHLGAMIALNLLWAIRIQEIKTNLFEKTSNIAIATIVFFSAYNLKDLNLYDHWFLTTITSAIICYGLIAATPIVTHQLRSSFSKKTRRAP